MPTISRVVHVGSDAALTYRDRQLRIERAGHEPASVPIEDLGILVLDHTHTTVSVPLLAAVTAGGGAVVVCGAKHLPEGLLLPVAGNALHARVLREQIAVSVPRKKRMWRTVVSAKIDEQARMLFNVTGSDRGLRAMSRRVRSGDTDNLEGQAARTYFPALFGSGFIRDTEAPGLNSMLNYGYTLLRAAVARAVVGAGLHPALGVHHHNQYDAFALADDLMEPLRPMVDDQVLRVVGGGPAPPDLGPPTKRALLELLTHDVTWEGKRYPLLTALPQYAARARDCLLGDEDRLQCPVR